MNTPSTGAQSRSDTLREKRVINVPLKSLENSFPSRSTPISHRQGGVTACRSLHQRPLVSGTLFTKAATGLGGEWPSPWSSRSSICYASPKGRVIHSVRCACSQYFTSASDVTRRNNPRCRSTRMLLSSMLPLFLQIQAHLDALACIHRCCPPILLVDEGDVGIVRGGAAGR